MSNIFFDSFSNAFSSFKALSEKASASLSKVLVVALAAVSTTTAIFANASTQQSIPDLNDLPSRVIDPEKHQDIFLYAAYGSNMAENLIRKRVGEVKFVGIGSFEGYEFSYCLDGWAAIQEKTDAVVWVALYQFNAEQFKKMDKHESALYDRKIVEVKMQETGKTVKAWVYALNPDAPRSAPTAYRSYINLLQKAAKSRNLPPDYIEETLGKYSFIKPEDQGSQGYQEATDSIVIP